MTDRRKQYRAEVDTGEATWSTNALRFDTLDEAERYAQDLAGRWTNVRRYRIVEDTTPLRERVAS